MQEVVDKLTKEAQEKGLLISYCYDERQENVYLFEQPCFLDPVASFKKKEAVVVLPGECTFIKPPKTNEDEVALFDTDKQEWEVVKNIKGKKYYDIESKQIKDIKTYRIDNNVIILTKEDEKELYSGKSVKIENGKYVFYWTDEQCIDRIIRESTSHLVETDFYFNSDYPTEKIPVRMVEYREYLRTINSEKNLEGKDVQTLKVLTYEEFANKM